MNKIMKKNVFRRYFRNEEEGKNYIVIDFYSNRNHMKHQREKIDYRFGMIKIPNQGITIDYCDDCKRIIAVHFNKREFGWIIHSARMWLEDIDRLNRLRKICINTDWYKHYKGLYIDLP